MQVLEMLDINPGLVRRRSRAAPVVNELQETQHLFDDVVLESYTDLPEFAQPFADGILYVDQSKYATGDIEHRFVTQQIRACSGIILRSDDRKTFGLYHASPLPMLDLSDIDLMGLRAFAGGTAIEIKGSESTSKAHVFSTLRFKLGITHVGTVTNSTHDANNKNRFFHVAFRPKGNEILIARNSHRDVLKHQAFS